MFTPPHLERLSDQKTQEGRIGAEFAGKRGSHLKCLSSFEDLIREHAPLPTSSDVARTQPAYFNEFTYTECMGCLWVTPQSSEIAARMMLKASQDTRTRAFDVYSRLTPRDKYDLGSTPPPPASKTIAFVPGSNCFKDAVSREQLTRLLHSTDALVKLHPLSNFDLVRDLGREFGYHRLLDPKDSGFYYLDQAETVWTAATSELGLYAVIQGKPIFNLTTYHFEARSSYSPFYFLLWSKSVEERRELLRRMVNSPYSGFVHPDDPNVVDKLREYFKEIMTLREVFKPLMYELSSAEYSDAFMQKTSKGAAADAVRAGR